MKISSKPPHETLLTTIRLTQLCILEQILQSAVTQGRKSLRETQFCNDAGVNKALLTHEEVGGRGRLAVVLLDVFGFVGDHPDEGVELKDGHTQVDDVHWIPQESPQSWDKVCGKNSKSTSDGG